MSKLLTALDVAHKYGWPTCAVCNAPVERIESEEGTFDFVVRVRAYCHGESEEVELTHEFLCAHDGNIRLDGVAFAGRPKRLPRTGSRCAP